EDDDGDEMPEVRRRDREPEVAAVRHEPARHCRTAQAVQRGRREDQQERHRRGERSDADDGADLFGSGLGGRRDGGADAAIATTPEPGPEEVRAIIRVTAFTSAVPFLLIFTASALHRLRRSAVSRWLMANRRYLGLSVAASHFWHLIAIVVLIRLYSSGSEPIATTT